MTMAKPYYVDDEGNHYLSMEAIKEIMEATAESLDEASGAVQDEEGLATVKGGAQMLLFLTGTFGRIHGLIIKANEYEESMESVAQDTIEEIYDFLGEQ